MVHRDNEQQKLKANRKVSVQKKQKKTKENEQQRAQTTASPHNITPSRPPSAMQTEPVTDRQPLRRCSKVHVLDVRQRNGKKKQKPRKKKKTGKGAEIGGVIIRNCSVLLAD
jgi:hypothetical protein